jgi:YebC/PmpR family DNA-binding regulatory protein
MSGHSKWHSIKHKKAAVDAKRGRIFTRLIKEITVAARLGGGDPEGNARLRTAILAAKDANMPQDNITRAIKKGTGELEGVVFDESTLEGYAPGGVAVMVNVLTDNKNRTLPEIRHLFSKHGGNLGEQNSVNWMFERKGYFVVDAEAVSEDHLLEAALEAGAEDVQRDGSNFEVTSSPDQFETVLQALRDRGIATVVSEIKMLPKSTVRAEGPMAKKVLNFIELLEEHDDVQNVWANFDIDESDLED